MPRRSHARISSLIVFSFMLLATSLSKPAPAQSLGPYDRDSARAMLNMVRDDLKGNYYDQTFHGLNLEERFKDGEARIKTATTRDQLMIVVAQSLLELNDSHTFFVPPARAARIEYGWQLRMVKDECFVSAVKPQSDAEAKGLKPGDLVLSVDGAQPTRGIFWKMLYRYYALMPSRTVRMIVRSPGDSGPRQIEVLSKIQESPSVTNWGDLFIRYLSEEWDLNHDRFFEVGNEMLIWKMPTFEVSKDHVDAIMGKARKFNTLVIDLRGNGGGYVDTLSRLVSHFFDKEIKIADLMTAKYYDHQSGVGRILYFGASVTIADMIMTDGKSLEHVGVVPDEMVLPTGADLAAGRDPVLARAAEIAGVKLMPEKAGSLFPVEWKRQ